MLNVLYLYIHSFCSLCAVRIMAVFCSSLISCFPRILFVYFLNDCEIVRGAATLLLLLLLLSSSSSSPSSSSCYLLTQYCAGDKIERNEMGWACGACGWGEGVYRVLVGKPEGRRPLGRPRHRWVDNIRMDLQEVGCGYMDWIGLAQDRDGWRTLVSAVMNLRVPWNAGNFLTSCRPVCFSGRTLHHGVSKEVLSCYHLRAGYLQLYTWNKHSL